MASLPEAATSFGAVVSGGELFLYGDTPENGIVYTADKVSGAFHRIALRNGASWRRCPAGWRRRGPPLVAVDGRLYRVGGMAARNLSGETANLQSLDSGGGVRPRHPTWNELPPCRGAQQS